VLTLNTRFSNYEGHLNHYMMNEIWILTMTGKHVSMNLIIFYLHFIYL